MGAITMATYILLFRAVNVGGNNLLPMKPLTLLLQQCGYTNVSSYIQSGNVVLNGDIPPAANITTAIASQFGFTPAMLVLTQQEFEQAVTANPYHAADGKTAHVYFADTPFTPDLQKLSALATANERFAIKDKVFYLYAPEGIGRSKLVTGLEKCLGVAVTGRNLNTVNKLREMVRGS